MLKQDSDRYILSQMKEYCPFCDNKLYFASTAEMTYFIYCATCRIESKNYSHSKQEAAKDWMDVAIEKEAELGEQEFAQVFTMHCEFEIK